MPPGERLLQRVSATRTFARIAPHFIPALDRAVHRLTGGRCCSAPGCCPG